MDWEEQHQSTFVHIPKHDIEEGGANQSGTGSSTATGGGGSLPLVLGLAKLAYQPGKTAPFGCCP